MKLPNILVFRRRWIPTLAILWGTAAYAVEKDRLWVDAKGKFTVQARLISADEDTVKLRRQDDHKIITVNRLSLSDIDRKYLEAAIDRISHENPLRFVAPEVPSFEPLPVFRIGSATGPQDAATGDRAVDGTPIQWDDHTIKIPVPNQLPAPLPADGSPASYEVAESVLPIFKIKSLLQVSQPIPIATVDANGIRTTSVAVSVSAQYGRAARIGAEEPLLSPSRIVRFSPADSKAFTAFQSDQPLRLLDHHQPSQKSLAIIGKSNRKRIGELVVMEGWQKRSLKLTRRLKLNIPSKIGHLSKLTQGILIDDKHALLTINRSVGLWNLETGNCIYRMDNLDPRSRVAVSGGRRYFAVPFGGGVDLRRTDTGEPLGKILVEKQAPGVSFSSDGSKLAIATSKRLRVWDLTAAALSADISTRRSFGTKAPIWVDSDYVLTGSGLLVSLFRAMPVWRYELGTDRIAAVGNHVAVFRKHPIGELSVLTMPHEEAIEKIQQIDNGEIEVDRETWRIAEQSRWQSGRWVD